MERVKPGDKVLMRHYSGINPIKCVAASIENGAVSIRPIKESSMLNFKEGDPLVLGYEADYQVHIVGGCINSVNTNESLLLLSIDKGDLSSEKRNYKRFPVSLYADLRVKNVNERYNVIIKDISDYGMRIFAKKELMVNQMVELDIYLERAMLFLNANIVRKTARQHNFEYGLGLYYKDKNTLEHMKSYVKKLAQEQVDYMAKAIRY